jgi:mannose/cellobiose epimerase-like protein (N-acyl-D-glucosamine 2-epimerase family)
MQWNFIKTYQIDHEDGGVYESLHADGAVANPSKARMWKGGYHDGRALMNVTARLRKLAE